MRRLEELIGAMCPDGVEYKMLKDISIMQRGTAVTKKDLTIGSIPVISGGKEPAYYCDKYNREGETITIAGSGVGAGYVQYWNIPIWVSDAFSVKATENNSTKYLFYCLTNIQEYIYSTKKGSGVPHVYISSIDKVKIPIPPIEIQNEIVRILDNYTELTTKLILELTLELEARRKQYDYYRTEILTFNKAVQWSTLGEVAIKTYSGATPKANNPLYYKDGNIPWLRTQEVRFEDIYDTEVRITESAILETATKWIPKNSVIIAISGATAGRSAINKIPLTTNQHCFCLEIDQNKANYRYVFYWCFNQYKNLKALGRGARGDLNSGIIKSYPIPIPSLEEQQRIVDILDKYDDIYKEITTELQLEIEERQKQYEYYRDKLLTFKIKE